MSSWPHTDFKSFQHAFRSLPKGEMPSAALMAEYDAFYAFMRETGRVGGDTEDYAAFIAATPISGTVQPTTQPTQAIYMVVGVALLLMMFMPRG